MYELILTMKRTPYGMRIGGPDPNRAIYLPIPSAKANGIKRGFDGEHVWHSPLLDVFVLPTVDSVDVKIKIHRGVPQPAAPAAKAA